MLKISLTRHELISKVLPVLRAAPLLAIAGLAVLFGRNASSLTVDDVLHYTPENLWIAAAVLIGSYAFKSLTVVFPIVALYIAAGVMFPPAVGILVNLTGLAVSISIPYWIGRFSGRGLMERLLGKHPKARAMLKRMTWSEWFLAYFLRVINLLPGDLVGIILGSMGVRYRSYVIGSILGMAPTMIAATILGVTIADPLSPGFLISAGFIVMLSLISAAVYLKMVKQQGMESE